MPRVDLHGRNASNATLDLLAGIAAATDEVSVRADIDDAGFVVVGQLLSGAPAARSRRYDVETYLGHLGLMAATVPGDRRADVDAFRGLYAEHRTPLHEEVLLTDLLDGLSHHGSG